MVCTRVLVVAMALSIAASPVWATWTPPNVLFGGQDKLNKPTALTPDGASLLAKLVESRDGTAGVSFPGTNGSSNYDGSREISIANGIINELGWTPYTNVKHYTIAYLLDQVAEGEAGSNPISLGTHGAFSMVGSFASDYHNTALNGQLLVEAADIALKADPNVERPFTFAQSWRQGLKPLYILITTQTQFDARMPRFLKGNDVFWGVPSDWQTWTWDGMRETPGEHYSARLLRVDFVRSTTPIGNILSVDSRIVYGQPDVSGALEADPNEPATHVVFHPWTYNGGLFLGRSNADLPHKDKSGLAQIQGELGPVNVQSLAGSGASNPKMILSGVALQGLSAPAGHLDALNTELHQHSSYNDFTTPVLQMNWFSRFIPQPTVEALSPVSFAAVASAPSRANPLNWVGSNNVLPSYTVWTLNRATVGESSAPSATSDRFAITVPTSQEGNIGWRYFGNASVMAASQLPIAAQDRDRVPNFLGFIRKDAALVRETGAIFPQCMRFGEYQQMGQGVFKLSTSDHWAVFP